MISFGNIWHKWTLTVVISDTNGHWLRLHLTQMDTDCIYICHKWTLTAVTCDTNGYWLWLHLTQMDTDCGYIWHKWILTVVTSDTNGHWLRLHVTQMDTDCGYIWHKWILTVVTSDTNGYWLWLHLTQTDTDCGYIWHKWILTVVTSDTNGYLLTGYIWHKWTLTVCEKCFGYGHYLAIEFLNQESFQFTVGKRKGQAVFTASFGNFFFFFFCWVFFLFFVLAMSYLVCLFLSDHNIYMFIFSITLSFQDHLHVDLRDICQDVFLAVWRHKNPVRYADLFVFPHCEQHVLQREENWNNWKNEGCPSYERAKAKDAPKPKTRSEAGQVLVSLKKYILIWWMYLMN